ncbi:MAG: hypothetical protein WCP28_14300 [Actinomycetes bacterium]
MSRPKSDRVVSVMLGVAGLSSLVAALLNVTWASWVALVAVIVAIWAHVWNRTWPVKSRRSGTD